jgi:hypothetical protein
MAKKEASPSLLLQCQQRPHEGLDFSFHPSGVCCCFGSGDQRISSLAHSWGFDKAILSLLIGMEVPRYEVSPMLRF